MLIAEYILNRSTTPITRQGAGYNVDVEIPVIRRLLGYAHAHLPGDSTPGRWKGRRS